MHYNSEKHRRRSIRLQGYDYSQPGAYFVTICTRNKACLFGEVVDGDMVCNAYGHIVGEEWHRSSDIRRELQLDAFVAMPNHIHGIVILHGDDVGAHSRAPLRETPSHLWRSPKSLGSFIAGYKSAVTKRINEIREAPGVSVWQRNYYEHIVRNETELNLIIREYIQANPLRWHLDRENLQRVGRDEFDRWLEHYARPGAGDVGAHSRAPLLNKEK